MKSPTPEDYARSIRKMEEDERTDPGIPLSCGDAIPLSEIMEALTKFIQTHTFTPKQ